MGFLIKSAFWLSLVLLFIPFDVSDENGGGPTVGPFEAFMAASAAASDIAGMCERRPYVCDTGMAAMRTIGLKAREGVRMANSMLEDEAPTPDEAITTGSVEVGQATID
jgi:hypothetical protein